ncbi:hypothetical protein HPB47_025851 [Ixodes persulcatus]|uniref:Uncharacterized protein n=1 Tax=Ixodes persulcatus TaxID=34615 RepID=A0AC60Q0C7_IXOPE|nr:hypothetical protein HPB47_025851 [Ixodes persulcatus]
MIDFRTKVLAYPFLTWKYEHYDHIEKIVAIFRSRRPRITDVPYVQGERACNRASPEKRRNAAKYERLHTCRGFGASLAVVAVFASSLLVRDFDLGGRLWTKQ